jgi:hypothetical protein
MSASGETVFFLPGSDRHAIRTIEWKSPAFIGLSGPIARFVPSTAWIRARRSILDLRLGLLAATEAVHLRFFRNSGAIRAAREVHG